ncbi:MAG TPA: phosphodiester glycosidase family protein [Micromonosporaceae bacterium]|nr:phosphodiester glycosidase family protein [Micromonosporaceae bacterium]
MKPRFSPRSLLVTILATVLATGAAPARATADPGPAPLPLGPATLDETRSTRTLAPGVTLTTIVRGHADPSAAWTVEVAIPAGPGSPDPDAPPSAISDATSAQATAQRLRDAGLEPVIEQVTTPTVADAGGDLGFRVRVGAMATRADADAIRARVIAAGLAGSSVYTGWDGEADDTANSTGPWRFQVLTIDPLEFRGSLHATYGPDLERRETTSELSRLTGATAAINAGFFVLDPAAGAPGDPAGAAVFDGVFASEPIDGRPVLALSDDARHTEILRLDWYGSVTGADGRRLSLDGYNRVPGLIRNCGGSTDDRPTSLPLHDFTCTDPDELVGFDGSYGARTPAGSGAEVVLDRQGRVVETREQRGGTVPPGGQTVQATGTKATDLLALARLGHELLVRTDLVDERGRPVALTPRTAVVNGGPELVRHGEIHATPATDGMLHPGRPSFYYGWVHKRNPRTFGGVDPQGRTVLVTVDGRGLDSMGLSIGETAAVAKALGLIEAVNLDGGGSTTMVADGIVVNRPSDAAGERPVGDALVVLSD